MGCQPRRMPWIDRCVNFRHLLTSVILQDFPNLLLPDRCRVCGQDSPSAGYCPNCAAGLDRHEHQCRTCGVPFTGEEICGQCQRRPSPILETIAPFKYIRPISDDKYHRMLAIGRDLGTLLAPEVARLACWSPDVLVPVPLHWKRQFWRGFNQSAEIARPVSDALDIPIDLDLIRRGVNTVPQVGLKPARRRRNIQNAFQPTPRRMPDSAAIIDDVITSGSTVTEVAHCLRNSGVKRIVVWALVHI